MNESPGSSNLSEQLAGKRILVLNWRDIRHSQAGGAEQYMHEISHRWVRSGAEVTWFTSREAHQPAEDVIDGIRMVRSGGPLSLYGKAALRMLRTRSGFDAVVDCQNGIPFFSPLFLPREMPIVQLIHHVHQDQFRTRFSAPMAAVGRLLESTGAKAVYGRRAIAAVSPSTRLELRKLGFAGAIHVVPNGTIDVPKTVGPRDPEPTVVVVSRLVPHKRLDLLLGQLALAAASIPKLRLEIVGDGPERPRLQQLAMDLGLDDTVTFHGYQPNHVRDSMLNRAWLTVSTSASEGWGCSVIEAAAWGVPCLALRVPGIRDSVVDGRTGWLVDTAAGFGPALVDALTTLSEQRAAGDMSARCQEWARCFTWDRSAALLAGVLLEEEAQRREGAGAGATSSDMSTLVHFDLPAGANLETILRPTDEVAHSEGRVSVLMKGKDEFEAFAVMRRIGVVSAELRAVGRSALLAGPGSTFTAADAVEGM
ncbi:glycosyltransferase involved in cell wall biosynthesis [Paenarthrobacter nitroguajacolicus]|uniref:glycosyltransferase family 4 protein n=1 Tax=Paenarthrobacter TaxID=1742992 RepID=UPI00285C82B1|nr:glycosyltransferase family 4 protein [Paenarthrobacter nitroguajacolicus]MDR6985814.1 glycosyltransferase involved in cell wall biosynthesis [Paenarthrobacter nitroguajacolicus]